MSRNHRQSLGYLRSALINLGIGIWAFAALMPFLSDFPESPSVADILILLVAIVLILYATRWLWSLEERLNTLEERSASQPSEAATEDIRTPWNAAATQKHIREASETAQNAWNDFWLARDTPSAGEKRAAAELLTELVHRMIEGNISVLRGEKSIGDVESEILSFRYKARDPDQIAKRAAENKIREQKLRIFSEGQTKGRLRMSQQKGDELYQFWLKCSECGIEHSYTGQTHVGPAQLCDEKDCAHPLVRHEITVGPTFEDDDGEFDIPRFT